MSDNFNLYSQYYDLLYEEKKYDQEVEYVHNLIHSYAFENANKLLDLGSGTGKHGKLFAEKGYDVIGLEKSANMVAVANKEKCKTFNSIQGNIVDFYLNKKFDVVTALFHVISYVNNNQDLDYVFNNVHSHLNKGGIFIFDVWFSPAVITQKPETRVKRLKNNKIEVVRIAEPVVHHQKNVVDVNYQLYIKNFDTNQIEEFQETHPMRHFSIPEIEFFADKNDFQVLKMEEFLTGNQPSEKTWGVCFVLRKVA